MERETGAECFALPDRLSQSAENKGTAFSVRQIKLLSASAISPLLKRAVTRKVSSLPTYLWDKGSSPFHDQSVLCSNRLFFSWVSPSHLTSIEHFSPATRKNTHWQPPEGHLKPLLRQAKRYRYSCPNRYNEPRSEISFTIYVHHTKSSSGMIYASFIQWRGTNTVNISPVSSYS